MACTLDAIPSFLKNLIKLVNLFTAAVGPCCCVGAFSSCSERGLLVTAVHSLLIVVISLVAERGL